MEHRNEDWASNRYYQRISRVLTHIQDHLDRELSLPELAEVAGLSSFHFHRVFRGMVGETVKAYVRRLRLERAASLLRYSDAPLADLVLGSGYEAQESFTRAFKAAFGAPPATYRKLHRAATQVAAPPNSIGPTDSPGGNFEPQHTLTTMDIRIETRAPQRAICVPHIGPYREVGSCFETLCSFAGRQGLLGPGAQVMGLSYDDPDVTPEDKLRYRACLSVDREVEVSAPIEAMEIPGGEYAAAVHEGPYERLKQSYDEILGSWLPTSGRELREAPCIEIYLNDPTTVAPAELRTQIFVPLA